MASSKVMTSTSSSRNSDLSPLPSHHHHHHRNPNPPSSSPMISDFPPNSHKNDLATPMTVDGILRGVYGEDPAGATEATLLDAEITLIDAAGAISAIGTAEEAAEPSIRRQISRKTVDDVWREIEAGKSERIKECKVEASDEVMTLEDFLAKNGAGMEAEEDAVVEDVKMAVTAALPPMGVLAERINSGGGIFGYDPLVQSAYPAPAAMREGGVIGFGNGGGGGVEVVGGRGKRRGGPILEPLDKAAQQRQRRMIKNRESAARSRERKQAYQVELESLAVKLEEENEQLLREKEVFSEIDRKIRRW